MTNKTRILIGGVLVVFGVWFYFTPHLAVLGLKAAAEADDAARVAGYVDFPALKQDLKAGYNAKLAPGSAQGKKSNPLVALGGKMTAAVVDPMVEALVTPEGLVKVFKGDNPLPSRKARRTKPSEPEPDISTSYESFNRFVVTIRKKGASDGQTGLVFNRYGLFGWKLSAVRLPR